MAISDEDIRSYVEANKGDPAAIAAAAQQYGISAADISRATGYSGDAVSSYFSNANLNPWSTSGGALSVVNNAASGNTSTGALAQSQTSNADTATTTTAAAPPSALQSWNAPDPGLIVTGEDGIVRNTATGETYVGKTEAEVEKSLATSSMKDVLLNAYEAGDYAGVKDFLERTGTSGYDLVKMYGLTPEQAAEIETKTGFSMTSKTITDYEGKEYDTATLLKLAGQLAQVTDPNSISGGVYAEKGIGIGFTYDEAVRAVGHGISTFDAVLLDAARNLMAKGVTDLSQLKQGDIKGDVQVREVMDSDGRPTGQYEAYYTDSEGFVTRTQALTPEEAARITRTQVGSGGDSSPYEKMTLGDVVLGRGLLYGDQVLSEDPNALYVGSTYAGKGGTNYRITYDDKGQPHFTTYGTSSSDLDDFSMALTFASFIPGVAPFAALANAAIAASQGNTLGALASLATAGGYTDVATGFGVASAVERGDLGALVSTLLANPTLNAAASTTMLTDTISLADVGHATNVAINIEKGNFGAALTAAGSLVNSPDLKIAGAATTVVQELQKDNPNFSVILGAAKALQNATSNVKIDSKAVQTLTDKATTTLNESTSGTNDTGASVFVAAKDAGATDEEAMAAANAVTGKTDAVMSADSSTTSTTGGFDKGEFEGVDEAVDQQSRNTEVDRLVTAYEKQTGKTLDKLNDKEIAALSYATNSMSTDQLKNASIQDILNRAPAIVGKDDQGRWVDDKGYAYDERGLKYAPGSNTPMVEIIGVGDKQLDAAGNVINAEGPTAAQNLDTAGTDLLNWANSIEGTSGEVVRQTLSTLIGAGGEQIADLGTALANMGVADRYNLLAQLGQSLERTGTNLEIPGVTEATRNFWNDIQGADTYAGKVAAAFKSVVNNPLVLTQVAKEGLQEILPILTGGAVFRLAGATAAISTDLLLNAAESMGSTSRQKFNEEVAKGTPVEEAQRIANADGWKAFGITAATAGITDASIIKGYEKAMDKVVGRVTTSYGKEFGQEGFEELAIALATGDDLATALTKSVVGSAVGSKTSGSISAGSSISADLQQAFESEGLTSTDGSFRPETIVKIGDTGATTTGDATTTAAIQDAATVISDAAATGGDTAAAVTTAVTNGVESGANPTAVVDAAVSTSLDSGANSTVAVGSTVTSALDAGVKADTAIGGAVDAAVNSGVDSTIATATAVNSATNAGVDSNTATNAATNTNTNTGTNVTVDTNTNTTTATDTNTNTNTTVSTDTNTNTTTTVTTNTDTGTTVTTETNTDTGGTTTTVVDGSTGDTIVVNPDGSGTNTTTGETLTPDQVKDKTKTTTSSSSPRKPPTKPGGVPGAEPTYPYKPTNIEETWLGGRFRSEGPAMAAFAALLGNTPMQQETEAFSALRRASGITDKAPNTDDSDYFSYGREVFPEEVLGTYRNGGTVQNRAVGGKIMTSPLMAAAGGDVPHKGSHYVQGAGGGQDDLIPAKLADGEYVFDAEIVAALGDGSNKEGAKRLDAMREAIRRHKRSVSVKTIPPKAKSPLAYLKESTK